MFLADSRNSETCSARFESAVPHERMTDRQVAAYVHLNLREVVKLASRGQIPCRKIGGRFTFRKGEVDHWVESHMHTLDKERLAGIERGVSSHHGWDNEAPLVGPLIPDDGVAVPLNARTGQAAIRALVDVADRADLIYARDELLREIREREDLCPTALCRHVALPHPRHPVPYDIAAGFIVVGLTPSGVPYGCPDGSLTRLFFLICCKDDRTHLHVLARLAQMLHDTADVTALLASDSAEELSETLRRLEMRVVPQHTDAKPDAR